MDCFSRDKARSFAMTAFAGLFLTGCSQFMNPFGTDNLPPPAKLTDFKPERTVIQQWATKVGNGVGDAYLKLSPAYYNETIFAADKAGRVLAVNMHTGVQQWQVDTKLPITSGLAAEKNTLIVGANDGQVLALNTQNGQTIWRARVQNQVLATPAVVTNKVGGIVLIKTIDGQVCSLDLNTGKQNWCHDHGAPILQLRGSSAPQYADGLVIVGFSDGKLVALNVHTGKQVWERAIAVPKTTSLMDQLVDIDVDPRIWGGAIYVATYQGNVASVSLHSGRINWEHPISSYAGLAVNHQFLFVSDAQSTVYAFDRMDGDIVWQQKVLANRFITGPVAMLTAPISGKSEMEMVVVGDKEGYLHWLAQSDGRLVARALVEKKHGMIAEPLVPGATMAFVYTTDGRLKAYRVR